MRTLLFVLILCWAAVGFAATPSFNDFNVTQFNVAGNKVSIKNTPLLTNAITAQGLSNLFNTGVYMGTIYGAGGSSFEGWQFAVGDLSPLNTGQSIGVIKHLNTLLSDNITSDNVNVGIALSVAGDTTSETFAAGSIVFTNTIIGSAGSSIYKVGFISSTNGFSVTNAAGTTTFSVTANGQITASNLVNVTNIAYTVITSTNGEKILNIAVTDTQNNTNAFSGFTLQYNGTNMVHMPGGFGGRSGIIFGSNTYNNLGVPTKTSVSGVAGKDYLCGNGPIQWGHAANFTIATTHALADTINTGNGGNAVMLSMDGTGNQSPLAIASAGTRTFTFHNNGLLRLNGLTNLAGGSNYISGNGWSNFTQTTVIVTNDGVRRKVRFGVTWNIGSVSGNPASIVLSQTNGTFAFPEQVYGMGTGASVGVQVTNWFETTIYPTNTWQWKTNNGSSSTATVVSPTMGPE